MLYPPGGKSRGGSGMSAMRTDGALRRKYERAHYGRTPVAERVAMPLSDVFRGAFFYFLPIIFLFVKADELFNLKQVLGSHSHADFQFFLHRFQINRTFEDRLFDILISDV